MLLHVLLIAFGRQPQPTLGRFQPTLGRFLPRLRAVRGDSDPPSPLAIHLTTRRPLGPVLLPPRLRPRVSLTIHCQRSFEWFASLHKSGPVLLFQIHQHSIVKASNLHPPSLMRMNEFRKLPDPWLSASYYHFNRMPCLFFTGSRKVKCPGSSEGQISHIEPWQGNGMSIFSTKPLHMNG